MRVHDYEAELMAGLEDVAARELAALPLGLSRPAHRLRPGFLRFSYDGDPAALSQLRSVIAVYRIHHFDIPRPKALLGHQHFTRLACRLRDAKAAFSSPNPSLGIGVAGRGSSVIKRLQRELAAALAIELAEDGKGQLYLRLLPRVDGNGWEALIRLTERTLSKRDWRAVDVPGALNATVAYAMTQLSMQPEAQNALNLCCGSGSIMIEHALVQPGSRALGIDHSWTMLDAATANACASGHSDRITLLKADAANTPIARASVERLYADLPFGSAIGSHQDNLRLYPALLREASRIASPDARFVLLTHELSLFSRCLDESAWALESERRVSLSGLHPRLFVLRRKSTRI